MAAPHALEWSAFGEKFTRHSGIAMLMEDIEECHRVGATFMGGGNPAQIPEVKAEMAALCAEALKAPEGAPAGAFGPLVEAISNYDGPRGKVAFVDALVGHLNSEFGWSVKPENVALTNGSQASFFYLFNLLCGAPQTGHTKKKVLLPVCPEYLGYADAGLTDDFILTARPRIDVNEEDRTFKYGLDIDAARKMLESNGGSTGVGLICVSRPTNPTGNVLTDAEVADLRALAQEFGVPLLLDSAYGMPFPRILFAEDVSMPNWSEDSGLILCFSLSKLGLPGARTGIVIARPELTKAIVNLNGVLALAPGSVGPAIAAPLLKDQGRMAKLCETAVRPWYLRRAKLALATLLDMLSTEPRVLCHRPEGCIFLWVWCRDIPVGSPELYQRLKTKGLYVIPGHLFFPGLEAPERWRHTQECMRVSYASGDDAYLESGLRILADAIIEAYALASPEANH